MPAPRESAVFVWMDRALFLGDRSETAEHAHNAVEVSVALDDAGLDLSTPDGDLVARGVGAIVRSDTPHRLCIHGPKVAVFYADPRSETGAGLEAWLAERDAAELPAALAADHRDRLRALLSSDGGLAQAHRVTNSMCRPLARPGSRPRVDPRIRSVLDRLADNLEAPPKLEEAAQSVGLSSTRLTHLFKEQVGLPMRRYVLWLRLRHALTQALAGASMAEAAHAAGFSDSAHFTRTCQRMFGLPPTAFAPVDAVFVASGVDDQFVQDPESGPP